MSEYKSRQERRQAINRKKGNGNGKKKGLFKKVFLSLILIFLFVGLAGSVATAIIISHAPSLDPAKLNEQTATRIYYDDGSLMETIGSKNRTFAPIKKIPDVIKNAVVSIEDARFYQHHGIDPIRIGGSVIANITQGFGAEGASTIDQQLIKLSYLTPKKTLTRKIQEAYLAVKLDKEYSKDKILEMYLNKIYYGERSYGVATAAYTYFGLDVDHLDQITLPQAALLAGIPNRPATYDPITHPDNAIARRNIVLDAMVNNGEITEAQAEAAKKVTMKEMLKNRPTSNEAEDDDHYAVVDMLTQLYVDTGKIDKDQWSQGGLKIYTTIDKKAQETVEDLLSNDANFSGTDENFQAGVAVTDTQNGNILAIGGGVNYQYGTNWALAGNTETGMGNQIGSTAKPIVDYGPAIEYLKWPTSTILDDSPHTYTGVDTPVSDWDNKYLGKMTMKKALALSRNVPAVRTLQAVDKDAGVSSVKKFASKLGVKFKDFNESYALGSFTANPLQMAGAYAAFGNNGIYNAPSAIKYIEYPDGRQVKFDHSNHLAMHDYTAYMITDMLKEVIDDGTYAGPSLSGYTVAGKSGSSNPGPDAQKRYHLTQDQMNRGYLDSWFVGYTPNITAAVWTGYDQTADVKHGEKGYVLMSTQEKHISNNLFGHIIRSLASRNTSDWKQPKSVVRVSVEKDSGLLASSLTPNDDIMSALYVRGTEPTKVSTRYQKLDAPKNLKAKYNKDDQTIHLSWDYDQTDNISFQVSQKFDNNTFQPLTNIGDHQVVVNNAVPGTTYEFSVMAILNDPQDAAKNKTSDAVTVSIKLPGNPNPEGPPNGPKDKQCEKHPDNPQCGGSTNDNNGPSPGPGPGNGNQGTNGDNGNNGNTGDNTDNGDATNPLDLLP